MNDLFTVIATILIVFLITMILTMWGWSLFMVPVFGMQALTVSQAFGFVLLTNMLKFKKND